MQLESGLSHLFPRPYTTPPLSPMQSSSLRFFTLVPSPISTKSQIGKQLQGSNRPLFDYSMNLLVILCGQLGKRTISGSTPCSKTSDDRKLTIISITVDSGAYHVQSMWTCLAPSRLMSFASAFSSL